MDIVLITLGLLLIVIGIVGSLMPILPGPPLSFVGILLLHGTGNIAFSPWLLWILGGLTVLTIILDYSIPQRGTKKFGGTKYGTLGSTIGIIGGLFIFPPVGLIIGPIIGAFVGEYLYSNNQKHALRSALGSLVGFILGVGIKLVVCGVILWYGVKSVIGVL